MKWIPILLALLFALPAWGAPPTLGRILVYGDSLSVQPTHWPKILIQVLGTTRVGQAAISGAHVDTAGSAGISVELQAIAGAGCTLTADLWGAGAVSTCLADISPALDSTDTVVILIGTNDATTGGSPVWNENEGPAWETGVGNVLTEAALFPSKCVFVNTIPNLNQPELDSVIGYDERARLARSLGENFPNCVLVDAFQHFEAYGVQHGIAALLGLYENDLVHLERFVANSVGDIGVDVLGKFILSAVYRVQSEAVSVVSQAPDFASYGTTTASFGLLLSDREFPNHFATNPLLEDWVAFNSGIWNSAGYLTPISLSTLEFHFYDSVTDMGVDDVSCFISQVGQLTNGDFTSCELRVDVSDYGTANHIQVRLDGGVRVTIGEMTGMTAINTVVANSPIGGATSADCGVFTIEGEGDQTIVRAWVVNCEQQGGHEFDIDNFGSCWGVWYDQSVPTTACTAGLAVNMQVDFSSSGFNSGQGVGLSIQDNSGGAEVLGISDIYYGTNFTLAK